MSETVFNREALLQALAIKPVNVDIPKLGGTVRLRPMTVGQRVEFTESLKKDEKLSPVRVMIGLLPQVVVGEDDSPLLTADDVENLEQADYDAISALIEQVMDINGMSKKAADDLKKNLPEEEPSCDSSTASPES